MIKEEVGKRIKTLRLTKGMSQEDFAFKCGLDRTYITSLERGKRNISLINLEKITNALGISLSEFFIFQQRSNNVKSKRN